VCGIAGIVYFDGRKAETTLLKRMTDAIAHRGPDGEGHLLSGPVGLGHRRLSIIDLSASGHQPMSNEDGSVWITYNGEIYNFRELRKELEEEGHVFRSRTDTEVVKHA
jgi:asparagine synthase (glutamine-hydrolysing)